MLRKSNPQTSSPQVYMVSDGPNFNHWAAEVFTACASPLAGRSSNREKAWLYKQDCRYLEANPHRTLYHTPALSTVNSLPKKEFSAPRFDPKRAFGKAYVYSIRSAPFSEIFLFLSLSSFGPTTTFTNLFHLVASALFSLAKFLGAFHSGHSLHRLSR